MLALEATRDLTHVWAHVDMDAFYASCEELAEPSLVSLHIACNACKLRSFAEICATARNRRHSHADQSAHSLGNMQTLGTYTACHHDSLQIMTFPASPT